MKRSTLSFVSAALVMASGLLLPAASRAQTVGPSPPTITTTINVPPGVTTTVVGSTTVSTTGTTRGALVQSGGTLIVDPAAGPLPGSITFQTVNGTALEALGTILVPNSGLSVQTVGGHALMANGAGSLVKIDKGAAVTTTGVGTALVAINGGTLEAAGVIVNNTATASPTISAGHGAVAELGGTIKLHAGTSITTAAFNSVGLGASGAGSQVIPDALIPVTMNGRGAMGVYLHYGGQVTLLPGSVLQMNGTSSVGIAVDNTQVALGTFGSGLTINLNGAGVPGQAGSTGLVVLNGGSVAIENLTVAGPNAAAGVWVRPGSSATVSGASVINISADQNPTFYTLATANLVTTAGNVTSIFSVTSGIPQAGLKSDAGLITSIGTKINVTSGNGAAGANTAFGGLIDMTANTITTTGAGSFGIRVDSGQVTGRDSTVTTSGGGAALFFNFGPGVIDLTNTAVLATGPNTTGLASLNGTPSSVNVFRISGGSLVSTEQAAIIAQGPLSVATSNGAVVSGKQALLLAFDQSSFFPQPTVVQLDASTGSILTGDAFADPLAIANINLMTGSTWTGAAFDVTNVTVDPTSVWTMTASSTVTEGVTNAGLIDFTPPAGGAFKTLTTKNYLGTGGTIGLNTFLGADASPSDKLVINGGTASGSSKLKITNAGGAGDLTVANGILVVDAINGGATVPGTFVLAGPVVAGPYEYLLFRGSRDASAPESWFLRSTLSCALPDAPSPPCPPPTPPCPPPTPPGPTPPGPVPPEPPNFRQETSLYSALPGLSLLYGRMLVDTLHQRVGEEEHLRARKDLSPNPYVNGAWGRVIAQSGNRDGGCPVLVGSTYDFALMAIQAGLDIYRVQLAGFRTHAGVYGALGDGRADVTHLNSIAAGRDTFSAYTTGGYWTLFGSTGWYLDGVVQGTFYDMRGQSTRFPALETDGWGFAASLEAGYPVRLTGGWMIEPQAQIVYQSVDLGTASDIGATVRFDDIDSLAGRIGVRFATTWAMPSGGLGLSQPSLVTAWFRPSYWHEFSGDPRTLFSSETGFIPFRANLGEDWIDLNSGITLQLDHTTALYASAAYQIDLDGRGDAWDGKIGLRVHW